VEGLASQLADLFDRGYQRPGPGTLIGIGIAAAVAWVSVGVWIVNKLDLRHRTASGEAELEPGGIAMVLGIVLGGIGVFVVGNWLFPGLELLEAGQNTRARRFRFATVTFLVGILSSLAATVVYELIR
jgi:H+/Cl- antiporter ClcA